MKINKELQSKWPWKRTLVWEQRAKMIAEIIPKCAKVIELGGGFCHLKKLLPELDYVSVDKEPWTDLTTVADLNKELPDMGLFDVIICQGIAEYITDPENFLKSIKKYGRRLIISYYYGKNNVESRANFLTPEDIAALIVTAGWELTNLRFVSNNEILFTCTML